MDREADRQDSGRLTAEWQTQSDGQEGQTRGADKSGADKRGTRERQTKRWTREGADKEIERGRQRGRQKRGAVK